jgi:hypothetical protein
LQDCIRLTCITVVLLCGLLVPSFTTFCSIVFKYSLKNLNTITYTQTKQAIAFLSVWPFGEASIPMATPTAILHGDDDTRTHAAKAEAAARGTEHRSRWRPDRPPKARYPTACKASILGQHKPHAPFAYKYLSSSPKTPHHITSHIRCGSSLRAGMASSSCALLGLACFVLLATAAGATQYKVGGDNGWAVPDATAESFNTWAEKTSFQIGDSLCGSLTHSLTRIRVWAFTCCARVLSSGRSHSLSAPSSS